MGAHEVFSQRVVYPLMRRVLPFGRRVAPHFAAGMRERRRLQLVSRAEREAWILGELRKLVRHAGAHVPFYRERFRAVGFDPRADFTFADYARLPPLEKSDIAAAGDLLLAEGVDRAQLFPDSTGGSTGVPTKLWKDISEKGWELSSVEFLEGAVGAAEGRRMVRIWGHHLDMNELDHWRKRLRHRLINVEYLDCYRMSDETFAAWHRRLEQVQPEALVCYASAIYLFARWLQAQGIRPSYPSRAIITSAEKLWPHQREQVRAVFAASLHERYGGRDIGLVAFQQDPNSLSLTVDSANILVEPAVGEGRGDEACDILVTKLHSYAMPMLRYRVGDMARFPADARPGHPTFALLDVTGRIMDRVILPGGASIHAVHFYRMFRDFDIEVFQVKQAADGTIDIAFVPGPTFNDEHQQRIEYLMRVNLVGATWAVRRVAAIERTMAGKLRSVISEVGASDWKQPALEPVA